MRGSISRGTLHATWQQWNSPTSPWHMQWVVTSWPLAYAMVHSRLHSAANLQGLGGLQSDPLTDGYPSSAPPRATEPPPDLPTSTHTIVSTHVECPESALFNYALHVTGV
jgi:hypothetical protein